MSQRWIPVSESMPDAELAVLIACRDADEPVWIGYHDGEIWRDASAMPADVTHWMNLPDPPPEEQPPEQLMCPRDFAKGQIITDDRFTYEVIEPDKRGMSKLKNLSNGVTEDWNAYNNKRFRLVSPPAGGGT